MDIIFVLHKRGAPVCEYNLYADCRKYRNKKTNYDDIVDAVNYLRYYVMQSSKEEIANLILNLEDNYDFNDYFINQYCHNDCDNQNECLNEKECILKWLNKEIEE